MQHGTQNYDQSKIVKALIDQLSILKSKNPSYSLRAYAKKMQFSPAALSEMISGKRKITFKATLRILDKLNLSPDERNKILKIEKSKKALSEKILNYFQIEMDQYHAISEWYYFGIMSLAETETFKDCPIWISERLNISPGQAKKALITLERLNLLKKNESNSLIATGGSFKATAGVPNGALRKSHADNLELAKNSLEQDDIEFRDFSSMTMAIDPDLLPEAKKMVLDFRRKLTQFLESEKKQEVYKLNIQLFPLSKKGFLK